MCSGVVEIWDEGSMSVYDHVMYLEIAVDFYICGSPG